MTDSIRTSKSPVWTVGVLVAAVLLASCATRPPRPSDIPDGLSDLTFLQADWSRKHGSAKPGTLIQIEQVVARPSASLAVFEFFDVASSRFFAYATDREELANASRAVAENPDENKREGKAPDRKDIEQEELMAKSWSNATDNRTRRAIADGFSDTHSIYQSLADYGGCSATVLSATSTRMVHPGQLPMRYTIRR